MPRTSIAVAILLLSIALLATGCMTEDQYRAQQRDPAAADGAPDAEDPRVRKLDGGEGLITFLLEGFEEPDGGPRLVRRKLERVDGLMSVVYDPTTGWWRVRYVRRKYTPDEVAQMGVDAAWEELRTKVTVRWAE